jgi:glycosyltransferase involved in cell wall biosynthesis
MKVVHLVHFFQPGYVGGIQRYAVELGHRQQSAGIDVSVFTIELPRLRGGAQPHPNGLNGSLPVLTKRAWGTFLRTPIYPPLLSDIRHLDADIVHVHGPSPWFDAALLASRPRDACIVLTLHNTFPRTTLAQRWLGRIGQTALHRTIARSKIVIAPHLDFARELIGAATVQGLGDRLRIVPPGVDHTTFRPIGVPRDPNLVIFVAHVRPEKGLHVLVEAVRDLPGIRLEVLATVSYELSYFRRVRRTAQAQLGDRVRFIIDPDPATLVDAYRRAGCVVVPSLGLESWNLVLLEAAACGAPCVRTDLPGMSWADFAVVVPANSPSQLADGIRLALTQVTELGGRASDAARRYSWDRTHQETLAAYRLAGR